MPTPRPPRRNGWRPATGCDPEVGAEAAQARSDALRLRHDAAGRQSKRRSQPSASSADAWAGAAAVAADAARTALSQHERRNAERLQQSGALEAGGNTSRRQAADPARNSPTSVPSSRLSPTPEGLRRSSRPAGFSQRRAGRYGEAGHANDSVERKCGSVSSDSRHRRERIQWSERSRRSEQQIAELEQRSETARLALQDLEPASASFSKNAA